MKDKLQEYIELNSKIKRMGSIMGSWRMEMNAENCKPLLDDGLERKYKPNTTINR